MIEKIQQDIKTSMLAREKEKVETLQGLKSALRYAEIDSGGKLTDEAATSILQKELKKRIEAAELFTKGGNQESADKELAEAEMIKAYLPEMPDEESIDEAVKDAIKETHAREAKDMGKVIGMVVSKFDGAVDKSLVAKIAKEKLS